MSTEKTNIPINDDYRGSIIADNEGITRALVEFKPKNSDKWRKLRATKLAQSKSPSGFSWGYLGSGPAALAHSILFHATHDPEFCNLFYQGFKEMHIANLSNWFIECETPGVKWTLDGDTVVAWVKGLYQTRAAMKATRFELF